MRRRGRKRPADAEFLLKQVAEIFQQKKEELGSAKQAANELNISLASFYKYAAGINVPDMDVLRAAKEKWGVKWKYLDPSEVLRRTEVRSPEQFVFSFLEALDEGDIEVVAVGPEGKKTLRISLKIHFPS